MNFIDYVPLARVTMKELPFQQHLGHMGLGVIGEMGELVDAVKKVHIYGKPPDLVNLTEEIGDALWYLAGYHQELQINPANTAASMSSVMDSIMPVMRDQLDVVQAVIYAASISGSACADVMQLESAAAAGEDDLVEIQVISSCIAATAKILGVSLEDAMDRNIAKLKLRYGDKFSEHAALNRDLDAERAVLEAGSGGH